MARKIPQGKQSSLYFSSEEEAKRVLQEEGRKLKYIALKVWRRIMNDPKPKVYIRTRDAQRSIKLGVVKQLGTDEWGIELTFENDLAYHDSIIGKNQPQGHAIMLISSGWKAKNLEKKIGIRERFTRYKGTNYLGQVIKEYEKQKHKGITLDVQWSGAYLK